MTARVCKWCYGRRRDSNSPDGLCGHCKGSGKSPRPPSDENIDPRTSSSIGPAEALKLWEKDNYDPAKDMSTIHAIACAAVEKMEFYERQYHRVVKECVDLKKELEHMSMLLDDAHLSLNEEHDERT